MDGLTCCSTRTNIPDTQDACEAAHEFVLRFVQGYPGSASGRAANLETR
jgi:hypothetical protein